MVLVTRRKSAGNILPTHKFSTLIISHLAPLHKPFYALLSPYSQPFPRCVSLRSGSHNHDGQHEHIDQGTGDNRGDRVPGHDYSNKKAHTYRPMEVCART